MPVAPPTVIGIKDGSTENTTQVGDIRRKNVPKRGMMRTWIVLADPTHTDEDVRAATGIPPQYYEYQEGLWVLQHKCREITTVIKSPFTGLQAILWEVDVEMDSDIVGIEVNENDPLQLIPEPRWNGFFEKSRMDYDEETGEPVVTTAGEPLILDREDVIAVLTLERWENIPFNPFLYQVYAGKLNSQPFYNFPIGQCKMMPMIVGPEKIINGVRYTNVLYTVHVHMRVPNVLNLVPTSDSRTNPWQIQILNNGWMERLPADGSIAGKTIAARDTNQQPIRVNLDPNGVRIPKGDLTKWFLKFNRNGYVDFNALNLGPFR